MKTNCIAVLLVAPGIMSVASSHSAEGDPEAGRRKTVTCNACHGQASMQSVPLLGGQSVAYFISSMRAYQDGKRGHATMRDVAKAYSDKELKNFAAYYAQFGKREAEPPANVEKPSGVAACEACHGEGGRLPVNPESAVIAGQKSAYMKTALREYRDGTRKQTAMQTVVANLTTEEMDALSEYFSRVPGLEVK